MTTPKEREKAPPSLFCPDCGVPQTLIAPLRRILQTKGQIKFKCKACGFTVWFSGQPVSESKPITGRDVREGVKTATTLIRLIK